MGRQPSCSERIQIFPDKIPKENEENYGIMDYGKNILMLQNFHGKQGSVFEGRRVTSLPVLECTADLLTTQYNGCKAYVAR